MYVTYTYLIGVDAPCVRLLPRSARAEMAAASRVAARLADLSHAQLAEIAVHGCESSPELKNKADALIAKVA